MHKALGIALSRMVQEKQISPTEAESYATGIMRGNALKFYTATWNS